MGTLLRCSWFLPGRRPLYGGIRGVFMGQLTAYSVAGSIPDSRSSKEWCAFYHPSSSTHHSD